MPSTNPCDSITRIRNPFVVRPDAAMLQNQFQFSCERLTMRKVWFVLPGFSEFSKTFSVYVIFLILGQITALSVIWKHC